MADAPAQVVTVDRSEDPRQCVNPHIASNPGRADRAASRAIHCLRFLGQTPDSGPILRRSAPETASLVVLVTACRGNRPRARPGRHRGAPACRQRTGNHSPSSGECVIVPDAKFGELRCVLVGCSGPGRRASRPGATGRPGRRLFGSPETNTDRRGGRAGPGPGSRWKFLEADRTEARAVRPVRSRLDAWSARIAGRPLFPVLPSDPPIRAGTGPVPPSKRPLSSS